MSLWGDKYIRKEVKQCLNQLVTAAAVKAVVAVVVKAAKSKTRPLKQVIVLGLVAAMPLQKAKASS